MVFAQTQDWISTKPTTVGYCTHCSISHSEEIKYTADNSLSIREAEIIPNNNQKKKKSYRKDIQFYMIFGTHVKIYR